MNAIELKRSLEKITSLAVKSHIPAERMNYALLKSALESEFVRTVGIKNFGLVPRQKGIDQQGE